jgi:hypothetical protein
MTKQKFLQLTVTLLILIALSLPTSLSASAAAVTFEPQQGQDQLSVEIFNNKIDSLDIIVRFPANPIYQNASGAIFDETIFSSPGEVGVPDLPVLRRDVELPPGSNYSIEILEIKSSTKNLGEDGLPASIPVRAAEVQKCDPVESDCSIDVADDLENPDEENDATTDPDEDDMIISVDNNSANSQDLFPALPALLINTYIVRGRQVGQFQFWPVQYDANNQTVQIHQDITVRINFEQTNVRSTSLGSAAYTSYVFDSLLEEQILNFNQGEPIQTTRDIGNESILIIAPNAFISTLSPLVSLKESQGHPVDLVSLSVTGSTPEAIKAYISDAYHNWASPPTYVMLVGDVNNGSNSMPAFIGESSQSVTDLYYGTVDGSDWIPDVYVGRLPARDTNQLTIMIDNLIAYNNLTGSESWIKAAALLASSDPNFWQFAEDTQTYVIQNHTQPADYTGTFPSSTQSGGDQLYAHTHSAGNSEVINAINNRRSLISYTGHGSRVSWGGPHFSQSNINSINHTGSYSVVTSFACVTGDFNTEESFGETWLLQPNKGAIAFIGSSANSFWGPDDVLERAMMDSLYSGNAFANNVSSFLYAGLMAVEASRPGTGIAQSRYYWETYNLLGDPSLMMLIDLQESDPNLAEYQPQLNTSAITIEQAPGQEAIIQLELTNAGSKPDSYALDYVTNGWAVNVKTRETLELAPGETTTLEISITIPESAQDGDTEQILLSVTSLNDLGTPPAKDNATIELKAIKTNNFVFLPLMISP